MFRKIAAIDIGSTSLKMIKAEQKIRSLDIVSLSSEPIEQGIDRNEAVKNAIESISLRENLSGYKLVCNIPTEITTLRTLEFPFSDKEKISNVIAFEIEDKLPFPVDETVNDFQILKSCENTRVLVAASEISVFNEFLSLFGEASLMIECITNDSNALFECFNYFRPGGENAIQIDFGHCKTTVNFISHNELVYTRCISGGISEIIDLISELQKISHEEAESMLRNLQIDIDDLDSNYESGIFKSMKLSKKRFQKIYECIREVIIEVLSEIKKTEKNVEVEYGSLNFNKIVISGGGSLIKGIDQFVADVFEIETSLLEFLPQFNDPQIQSRFCSSFGLVLSYINHSGTQINFMKGKKHGDRIHIDLRQYKFPILLSALSLVIFLSGFAVNSIIEYRSEVKKNVQMRKEYKKIFQVDLKDNEDPVQSARTILSNEKKELASIKSILPSDTTMLKKIENITSCFENDGTFNLTEMTIDEKSIRINGETQNSQNVDIFKNNLTNSGIYETVTLNTNMSSGKVTKFTIQIKLKQ